MGRPVFVAPAPRVFPKHPLGPLQRHICRGIQGPEAAWNPSSQLVQGACSFDFLPTIVTDLLALLLHARLYRNTRQVVARLRLILVLLLHGRTGSALLLLLLSWPSHRPTPNWPIPERAETAVIVWTRRRTTAYDEMIIPRIKGKVS